MRHSAPKKPGRKLPETQAMLHYLIAEKIGMKKRRKFHSMHQRIQALYSFRAAQTAQRRVISQNQYARILKFLRCQLQNCQQIAPTIIAYVQLKLILWDHGIEYPLDL